MQSVCCIFCKGLLQAGGSEEHVFPESLRGTLTFNHVCDSCSKNLGQHVDAHLMNHPLIRMDRARLGLQGKDGRVPGPFDNLEFKAGIANNRGHRRDLK